MTINIIIRIDDIFDKFDFYDLSNWFNKKFPQIPICFYVGRTQYKYMWERGGWKKIKDTILKCKWEIGGHSRFHSHFSILSKEELKKDIEDNIKDIEEGLRSVGLKYKITSFAYPFGEFNDEANKILKKNNVTYALTYPITSNDYKKQLIILKENLYEIGINCNDQHSTNNWNRKFEAMYKKGGIYILCLHTSSWMIGSNKNNVLRIFKSTSLNCFNAMIKRFIHQFRKKSKTQMWNILENHLNFIISHPDVRFITFKQLINVKFELEKETEKISFEENAKLKSDLDIHNLLKQVMSWCVRGLMEELWNPTKKVVKHLGKKNLYEKKVFKKAFEKFCVIVLYIFALKNNLIKDQDPNWRKLFNNELISYSKKIKEKPPLNIVKGKKEKQIWYYFLEGIINFVSNDNLNQEETDYIRTYYQELLEKIKLRIS